MHEKELKFWLWWNRVPGIGPFRFYKLLKQYETMENAWKAPDTEIQGIIGETALTALIKVRQNWDPDRELEKLKMNGFRVYCYEDNDYPAQLKKIADPPPVLYSSGAFQYGDDVAVGIVGTRNPTPLGAFTARELATQLSAQGLTIVSGMARGIDSESHWGAIQAGGRTVAVLGCGLDLVYPPENEDLKQKIMNHGVIVSEFPLGTEPYAKNFPARNRIISGLSLGIVVVEAAQDSGSLITANFALEQGREVFAVPGNIGAESSKGPHKLIRQGAKLVENYQDILTELAVPQLAASDFQVTEPELINESERRVMGVLRREPLHIDQVVRQSQMASAQVNAVLVQLELRGIVKRFPGQLYLRVK